MAATGLSNREIAQSPFGTVKTVEGHLGRVYAKLGVTARNELSSALGAVATSHGSVESVVKIRGRGQKSPGGLPLAHRALSI